MLASPTKFPGESHNALNGEKASAYVTAVNGPTSALLAELPLLQHT